MRLSKLCQRWLPRKTRGTGPPKPRRRGLRLTSEQLEGQTVPSSFSSASLSDLIADINAANAACGSNTITLAPGMTFTLTEVYDTTDGATGLPVIAANDDLTVVGNGDTIERKASGSTPAFRLLDVAAGASLTLQDLTLQGGQAVTYGFLSAGGAVYNQGALTMTGVTLQNNSAQGIDSQVPGGGGAAAAGGGIYSGGSLTLDGCTVQNNQAAGGHGGKSWWFRGEGKLVFRFPGGPGGNGSGGGVYVAGGTASLHNSTVTGNKAVGGQGGSDDGVDGLGEGGGLYIDPLASVCLDAFTAGNILKNKSSTSDSDVYGSYTTCP